MAQQRPCIGPTWLHIAQQAQQRCICTQFQKAHECVRWVLALVSLALPQKLATKCKKVKLDRNRNAHLLTRKAAVKLTISCASLRLGPRRDGPKGVQEGTASACKRRALVLRKV